MAFASFVTDSSRVEQIFAHKPEVYQLFAEANARLMRGRSDLSVGERELIGAFASALGNCRYCAGIHAETARLFGVDARLLEGLVKDFDRVPMDARFSALLAFVRKLCLSGHRLEQADADAVYAAGWSEGALHDAIAVCAFFAFMNRLVQGHGIAASDEALHARGRRHFEDGYRTEF